MNLARTDARREILTLAAIGLLAGLLLGNLAAGAFAAWRTGGIVAETGFATFLAHAPWAVGRMTEPFRIGLVIFAVTGLVCAALLPAIARRPQLTSHGAARWAKPEEIRRAGLSARLEALQGPVYAKLGAPGSNAPYLTSSEIPHSLIAAPTGSGKGVGVVIPTLLTWRGSVICLDVKGENFAKTARRRAALGDRVFKFAPYDPEGRTHRWNPMDVVAEAAPARRFTEARRLAAALIVAQGNATSFLEGAREIFAAAALLAFQRGRPTIGEIYDALSAPGELFDLFETLAEEAATEEAARIFRRMAGMESRILSSYLSVLADGGLSLWADRMVRRATEATDFDIAQMRRDPASVFIVVSPNDLIPLAPLVRLLFQQTVALLQRAEPGADEPYPVLLLLDEFASLGRMEALQQGITTLRSYGGRVMIVVQSIASLRDGRLYGREGASVFLANCRLQLFMAPADEETPEYVSRAVGDFTRRARSKSWRIGAWETSVQERAEGARLIRPEALRQLGDRKVVALIQNHPPVLAERVTYYEDKALAPLFEDQAGAAPELRSLDGAAANPLAAARQERWDEQPARPAPVTAEPIATEVAEAADAHPPEPVATTYEPAPQSQAREAPAVEKDEEVGTPTAEPGVEDCARIAHAFDDLLARVEAAEGRFAASPVGAG
ncbi:MAG: type IV secretion system ATPase VirD4 [Pseudooceanicola nanhaiensis]